MSIREIALFLSKIVTRHSRRLCYSLALAIITLRQEGRPMATVERYDALAFTSLNLFRTAKARLAQSRFVIRQLGDVFVKHNLHQRFGLSLLHKHFELFPDELLVRTLSVGKRVAHMFPQGRRVRAQPYLWRAMSGPSGGWRFYPLEYVRTVNEND